MKFGQVGNNGNVIEVFDGDTGHSIATRVVSGDQQTTYGNFEFTLTGRVEDGDVFTLEQDAAGQNDARNLDILIKLQDGDAETQQSWVFKTCLA